MSEIEGAKMSQKEYLRKYLGENDDGTRKKKKKKKKPKIGTKTVKIIDDDIDVNNMRPLMDGEFDIFNKTEDAPQIVGVVDERGPVDFGDKRRWRIIADDGDGNVACSENRPKYLDYEPDSHGNDHEMSVDNDSGRLKKTKNTSNRELTPSRAPKQKKHNIQSPDEDSSRTKTSRSKSRKFAKKRVKESDTESNSSDSSESSSRRKTKRQNKEKSKSNKRFPTTYDSDLSPPRRPKTRENVDSENRENASKSDSDLSPPRRSKKRNNAGSRNRGNSSNADSDLSPPRRPEKRNNARSRNRRNSSNADSDLSPPRRPKNDDTSYGIESCSSKSLRATSGKSRHHSDSRNRDNSDSDLSPPRRRKNNERMLGSGRFSSKSPVKKFRDSDSDLSPPRISRKDLGEGKRDFRRKNDTRHERHKQRSRMEEEISRMGNSEKSRRRSRSPRQSRSRWNDERSRRTKSPDVHAKNDDSRMKKTLDGKTAGLQDARALRIETEAHKKREAELFKKMSAEVSGAGQAAVLRDRKTGRRRDLAAEAAIRREKEKRQEEIDEKYAKWGKGLKQVDDQAEKRERDLYEMSKPLARYADDADLDKELREVMRADDPMMESIMNKQIKDGKREPEKPSYQGSYAPNRFGIKPGHRWDGVDRSNGYEKKWFDARNARTALQEEAYKWSTADM